MSYPDAIEQAAELEIRSAFSILVKSLASGEPDAPARFALALAVIEQARVAALGFTQQGDPAK